MRRGCPEPPPASTHRCPAGSPFNLTDAASVVSFMERALAALVARAADGTPSTVDSKAVEAAAAGGGRGRGREREAAESCACCSACPACSTWPSRAHSAWFTISRALLRPAGTITLLNGLLEQASAAAEADGMAAGGDKMVQVLARLAKVCQVSAAGAAAAGRAGERAGRRAEGCGRACA